MRTVAQKGAVLGAGPHSSGLMMLTLLAALGAGACAAGAAEDTAGGAATLARPAAMRGDFQRQFLLTGELEAVRSVSISSPQTSIFQMRIQYLAEEGSTVRAGDAVLDFDNSALSDRVLDLEAQILDAETQILARRSEMQSTLKDLEIEIAEKEYEYSRTRIEAEVEEGILSRREHGERQLAFTRANRELEETRRRILSTEEQGRADLDVLEINRDKLQKDLSTARTDMELLSIKAPADGLVIYEKRDRSTARYQVGDSCWPGQTIVRLPDLSAMQVLFHVNEVDARHLRVGMPVHMTMDSFPERSLNGVIEHIPSMAVSRDGESHVHVFKVVASLEETWPGEMKPGMSVLGRVVVDQRQDVAMVPRLAVEFEAGRYLLRRPDSDNGEQQMDEIHPVARNATHYVLDEEADAAVVQALGLELAARSAAGPGATP